MSETSPLSSSHFQAPPGPVQTHLYFSGFGYMTFTPQLSSRLQRPAPMRLRGASFGSTSHQSTVPPQPDKVQGWSLGVITTHPLGHTQLHTSTGKDCDASITQQSCLDTASKHQARCNPTGDAKRRLLIHNTLWEGPDSACFCYPEGMAWGCDDARERESEIRSLTSKLHFREELFSSRVG